MSLRSCAPTIGAMVGNHMLDRAEALVEELRIKPRWRADARQEAVFAELEGRDPRQAIRRFVRAERAGGMTGGRQERTGRRPDVLSFDDPFLRYENSVDAETEMLRREEQAQLLAFRREALLNLSKDDQRRVKGLFDQE